MNKIAIVGASGMVGRNFIKILETRKFPVDEIFLFASGRSAGQKIKFCGKDITIEELTPSVFENRGIQYALFGVSNELSKKYAPIAVEAGCIVIDNSSAWRMETDIPLIVPEVNGEDIILMNRGIIANPNCCAAPAVVALKPLQKTFGLKRLVISTYQSVSGAGVGGMEDLENTANGKAPNQFQHPIAFNLIPHIDRFHADGYTGEEKKLMAEIRKMLHQPELPVTATCVRVPVKIGHSLSINVTLNEAFKLEDIRQMLSKSLGVVLSDDPLNNIYPMPITAEGTDSVFVGRIRRDDSLPNSLNMWISCDNTRKGAALNAVQILELIVKKAS
ncbi:MAG: aspartate-semialdehyde dehydrogenase [Defluviitaleaceae bacterium]|nr:aspartate-semialdehyde dehydrogenase [Defluviitaleaceae bacterium]